MATIRLFHFDVIKASPDTPPVVEVSGEACSFLPPAAFASDPALAVCRNATEYLVTVPDNLFTASGTAGRPAVRKALARPEEFTAWELWLKARAGTDGFSFRRA